MLDAQGAPNTLEFRLFTQEKGARGPSAPLVLLSAPCHCLSCFLRFDKSPRGAVFRTVYVLAAEPPAGGVLQAGTSAPGTTSRSTLTAAW